MKKVKSYLYNLLVYTVILVTAPILGIGAFIPAIIGKDVFGIKDR